MGSKWAEKAREELAEYGKPATVKEIFKLISEDPFFPIAGKTPKQTLGNEMRRYYKGVDNHPLPGKFYYFYRPKRGRYGLIEWQISEDTVDVVDAKILDNDPIVSTPYPRTKEIDSEIEYSDGAIKETRSNRYERDPRARRACIEHWGTTCRVCRFNFETTYGSLGSGFIHVHHLVPLAERRRSYSLDPVKDLRPVCPNCHAMLHRRIPPLTIEELSEILHAQQAFLSRHVQ